MSRASNLLSLIKPGDVILTDSEPKWYELWLRLVYSEIRRYQRKKYPDAKPPSRTRDVHAMLTLDTCKDYVNAFSFEAPKAVIKKVWFSDKRTKYRLCRYRPNGNPFQFDPMHMHLLRKATDSLVGQKYDYGQLVDIWLKGLFPNAVPEKFSLFDLGRKRKVCSVAVHYCFLYWWRNFWRQEDEWGKPLEAVYIKDKPIASTYPRPLGKQYLETCAPADFANDRSKTFEVIFEE